MTTEEVKVKITPLLYEFGVKRAAVFGSVSRGENTDNSDVDLLLELREPLGLLKFARLNYLLEDCLQKKVDLVKRDSLKPAFRDGILHDIIYIYG